MVVIIAICQEKAVIAFAVIRSACADMKLAEIMDCMLELALV